MDVHMAEASWSKQMVMNTSENSTLDKDMARASWSCTMVKNTTAPGLRGFLTAVEERPSIMVTSTRVICSKARRKDVELSPNEVVRSTLETGTTAFLMALARKPTRMDSLTKVNTSLDCSMATAK